MWYIPIPKLIAINKPPTPNATVNSLEAGAIVPCDIAVIYAADINTPTTLTSCGFSVRSHKIPNTSDKKMINYKKTNIESNVKIILFNGSFANIKVQSSIHVVF